MGTKTSSTGGRFASVFPIGVAFCSLAATIFATQWVAVQHTAEARARADAEARHVAAQLKVGVVQAVEPLQRIAAWWLLQGRPLEPEDWANDAQLFMSEKVGLQKIVWLDWKGARTWTVRPGSLPDMDRRAVADPVLDAVIVAARHTNTTALSPAFDVEGKPYFYACAPIRKDGRLIAYIAGMYDATDFIHSLLRNQLPEEFRITVIANGRAFYVPEMTRAARRTDVERLAPVSVANVTWSVSVAPARLGRSTLEQLVMSFGVFCSLLLYVCAAMARTSRRRARELQAGNDRLLFENQERRRAEEKVAQLNRDLQRKLQEFQTLLDVLPIGIAIAEDPDCRQIWMNREMAKTLSLPLGRNISLASVSTSEAGYELLRNGVAVPPAELPMQVAVHTQAPVAGHYLDIVRSDGTVRHTLSYAAPLFDENGRVRGVIDACVDITERKQLEDRLQHAQKYQSLALMAGGIAHDFNNLLTVILGNAASAALELPSKSKAAQALGDVQGAATRAAELVAQLLAFTGRAWCQVQPMILSTEIEKLTTHIREMVPISVLLQYDLAADLPLIEADERELGQVVDSLVSNAVEALGQKEFGKIEIRTSSCELSERDIHIFYADSQLSAGTYVRLEVTDDGCGIPDEILARVFDPFFTTKFVGRGLGLSAVQGIVRAHGGAIRLDSSLHHGTRAEVIFRAYPFEPAVHLGPARPQTPSTSR